MQVKSYKGGASLQHKKSPDGLQVQLPGYVSTSSWHGAGALNEESVLRKGRVTTPPPSAAMGLHQLTLEAFWID